MNFYQRTCILGAAILALGVLPAQAVAPKAAEDASGTVGVSSEPLPKVRKADLVKKPAVRKAKFGKQMKQKRLKRR